MKSRMAEVLRAELRSGNVTHEHPAPIIRRLVDEHNGGTNGIPLRPEAEWISEREIAEGFAALTGATPQEYVSARTLIIREGRGLPDFLAVVAARWATEVDASVTTTLALRGNELVVNAEYVRSLSSDVVRWALAHMAMMVLLEHPARVLALGGTAPAHMASSYIVNAQLENLARQDRYSKRMLGTRPVEALYNPSITHDMTLEQVVKLIEDGPFGLTEQGIIFGTLDPKDEPPVPSFFVMLQEKMLEAGTPAEQIVLNCDRHITDIESTISMLAPNLNDFIAPMNEEINRTAALRDRLTL